jgi:HK97 gp10 family phage protein
MNISGEVYTAELDSFRAALDNAVGNASSRAAEMLIHQMGEEIAQRARAYAPVKSGELKRSIVAEHGPMTTKVVATAKHAHYVEFGTWSHNVLRPRTGTYEIRPVNAKALRFTGKDGKPVFTKVVRHPGIEPQPFLGRAHAEVLDEVLGKVGNVGVILVSQG